MTNAITLQRQYSLPNCTLVLEGLSDPSTTGQADIRPVMSLLINAECHLPGQDTPIIGGREFFESLVTEVSLYAQEFLSGIQLPRQTHRARPSFVKFERLDRIYHRMNVEKGANHPLSEERSVDLTTVQLFDLVEAIDQFVTDTQTLPCWSLNLSPVPKRYGRPGEPLAKQVVPASFGVSGLALAAIAFFSLPIMQVKTPECLSPGAADCPAAVRKNASLAASPTISPRSAASPTATVSSNPTATPATELTDVAAIESLQLKLYDAINHNWQGKPVFDRDLIYRVRVRQDGTILQFQPDNQPANEFAKNTPLPQLSKPTDPNASAESAVSFKVVFKPSGVLQINPWYGIVRKR